jgi:hypothetical protein
MIAVDTNILVYAHRADSEWHEIARFLNCGARIVTSAVSRACA